MIYLICLVKRCPDYAMIAVGATLCVWAHLYIEACLGGVMFAPEEIPGSHLLPSQLIADWTLDFGPFFTRSMAEVATYFGMVAMSISAWRLGWKQSDRPATLRHIAATPPGSTSELRT
jgi:hypothetical protein